MKKMTRGQVHRAWSLAAVVVAVWLGGCMSERAVYEEIYQNRQHAYEQWKKAREGHEGAQTVLKGELNISSAVLIAMGNNKELQAITTDKDAASGRLMEAYSGLLPKLDARGSYTRVDAVSAPGGVAVGALNNYQAELVLTQPIFHGGAIWAGIRGAKVFSYLTDQKVATTVQEVVNQVRRGYYDVLLGQELVSVSQGDADVAKAHLSDVEKKKAAGVSSQYDMLRARVDVSNVEAQLIERQSAVHVAMTTLLKTLGVSQESLVELTDRLEYQKVTPDIEEAVKTAYRERPEILQAELIIRLDREALKEAWAGFLPRLDASYARTLAKPDPHDATRDEWGRSWNAGLTLDWPVFDGLATMGRVRQAKAGLQKAVIELAGAEEQVLLEVKQAMFDLEDADKLVASQADNLERAREALRLVKAGYDAGVNTELEMLDARQALSQSQALYYQAVYKYEVAKLGLQRAQGLLKSQDMFGVQGAGGGRK